MQIDQFVKLYSGPVAEIQYQYSYILSVVYVTFVFGPGIPFLFILASLSLTNIYVIERLCWAYSYQKSAKFDAVITDVVNRILYFAPIFYFWMSAWLYSNQ